MFRYIMKPDKRVKWVTWIALVLSLGCFAYIYFSSSGSYLPAWFFILVVALLALVALSIPRFISLSSISLEIHCVLELTRIPLENIKQVRTMESRELKWLFPVPVMGIWGVFGYYGYYFDFGNLKLVKVYAKQWRNFIMVEDIYEEVVIISVEQKEEFLRSLEQSNNISVAVDNQSGS